jgi:hypothetical protein
MTLAGSTVHMYRCLGWVRRATVVVWARAVCHCARHDRMMYIDGQLRALSLLVTMLRCAVTVRVRVGDPTENGRDHRMMRLPRRVFRAERKRARRRRARQTAAQAAAAAAAAAAEVAEGTAPEGKEAEAVARQRWEQRHAEIEAANAAHAAAAARRAAAARERQHVRHRPSSYTMGR